jgi:hypothetical protein
MLWGYLAQDKLEAGVRAHRHRGEENAHHGEGGEEFPRVEKSIRLAHFALLLFCILSISFGHFFLSLEKPKEMFFSV